MWKLHFSADSNSIMLIPPLFIASAVSILLNLRSQWPDSLPIFFSV